MIDVCVQNGNFSDKEIAEYINRAKSKHPTCKKITLSAVGDDEVDITYECGNIPFDRIRRITGYLVGTLDRWNDAKRSEEHDRVKHRI